MTGMTCERVTSKADCEMAATQLGLLDTEASDEDTPDYPPYCYLFEGRSLYFNANGNGYRANSDSVYICRLQTFGK